MSPNDQGAPSCVVYPIFFIWGYVLSFVLGSLLYMHIFVTTAVCMHVLYICMIITSGKGKGQPGKVANPACGQLVEQGK